MALIVEDGTGLSLADSYISVAEADIYFAARENAEWAATLKDKDALLRRATDYIEQAFYGRWKGYRKTQTQRLSWPRTNVPLEDDSSWLSLVADNIVPERVRWATAELALVASGAELAATQERAQSSVDIDVISITYDPASSVQPQYPRVQMLLQPYLKGSGISTPLVRT